MTRKDKAIKQIIANLRPNTYMDGCYQWIILEKSLKNMSIIDLENLALLIMCRRKS